MKLHLPVGLFRAVLRLMFAAPAALYAAYTAPTTITLPSESGWDIHIAYSADDIYDYNYYSNDKVFRLRGSIVADSDYQLLMYSGSRYFTSYSASSLADFSTGSSSYRWFEVSSYESLTFNSLGVLNFSDANYDDGAVIYAEDGSQIKFSNNYQVVFVNNYSRDDGGAVYFTGSYGLLEMSGNHSVRFENNAANWWGGAICYGTMNILLNDEVAFVGNTASSGGAVYNSSIQLSNNGSVDFSGNTASSGGAVYNSSI